MEVNNISDYTKAIAHIHKDWETEHNEVWFRGVDSSEHRLLPGIIWQKLVELEVHMTIDFETAYRPLTSQSVDGGWQLYALMQHYGLPTRLLDWTKSPLVALYFALEKACEKEDGFRCIWAIDPFELNEICAKQKSVFIPTEASAGALIDLENYLPEPLRNNATEGLLPFPVAIEPPFTNKRILSQQGCFTVHGSDDKAIEDYFEKESPKKIKRILVPEGRRNSMLKELCDLGIGEESIYQDLNALSNRIKRVYKPIVLETEEKNQPSPTLAPKKLDQKQDEKNGI